MPIREESMDLFGYYSGQNYYKDKAFTSSMVNGNAIDLRATAPALASEYRVLVTVSEAAAGGTSVAVHLEDSADGTTFTDIPGTQGASVVLAKLTKGAQLLSVRLPQTCKRYVRAVLVPTGTFTSGKVFGNIEVVPN